MSTALQIVETYDISSIQVEIYMYKAQILKTRGDYYSYEKMQNTIQLGIDKTNMFVQNNWLPNWVIIITTLGHINNLLNIIKRL